MVRTVILCFLALASAGSVEPETCAMDSSGNSDCKDQSVLIQSKVAIHDHKVAEDKEIQKEDEKEAMEEDEEEEEDDERILLSKRQDAKDEGGTCSKKCSRRHDFMPLDGTDSKLLYYYGRNMQKIGEANTAEKAIVVFHGVGHNPQTYLCYVLNAMEQAGKNYYVVSLGLLQDAVINGPSRRRSKKFQDKLRKYKAINWPHFRDWIFGQHAGTDLSSYNVIEQVVNKLTDKSIYPNLKKISLVGHGGGAQVVHRVAAMPSLDHTELEFVVANPSTLLYVTEERPVPPSLAELKTGGCNYMDSTYVVDSLCPAVTFAKPDAGANTWLGEVGSHSTKADTYGDYGTCTDYNKWPFGLEGAPKEFENFSKAKFLASKVKYIAADFDTCNAALQEVMLPANGGSSCGFCYEGPQIEKEEGKEYDAHEVKYPLNSACGAMMSGLTRFERAAFYHQYLTKAVGANHAHEFFKVPGQHSACEIMKNEGAKPILFGD